jgi:hypothetical protein
MVLSGLAPRTSANAPISDQLRPWGGLLAFRADYVHHYVDFGRLRVSRVPAIFHSMLERIRINAMRELQSPEPVLGVSTYYKIQKFAAVGPGQPRLRGDRFGGTIQASTAGRMIRGN